jgi:hypothetical protein
MKLLYEALKKHRRESISDSISTEEDPLSPEWFCDRHEKASAIFFQKGKSKIGSPLKIFRRYWKIIVLMGCLLAGIFSFWPFVPSSESWREPFSSGLKATTKFLSKMSTQMTSWLRSICSWPAQGSSSPKVLEYLKQIKIQDIQRLDTMHAKIRIDNMVYLPGAIISDDPYIRFISIEQEYVLFEDRKHQHYSFLIEEMME